ncbi:MAG: phosphoethanolamine transferase [Paludibacteraceae bacterium]
MENTYQNRIIVIILSALCLLPVFYSCYVWIGQGVPVYMTCSIFALSCTFFIFPFFLFKIKTAFLINTVWVLLAPLEIMSLYLFQNSIKGGMIFFVLQTNSREAFEFLSAFRWLVVLYIVIVICYIVVVVKFVKNKPFITNRKWNYTLFTVTLFIFPLLYVYSYVVASSKQNKFTHNIKLAGRVYQLKFQKIYPCNACLALYNGFSTYANLQDIGSEVENFRFNAQKEKEIDKREVYVFVLGETARYANFGINGYHRETTPLLRKTDNLISFSNVLTEANSTGFSLPILLTRSNALNFNLFKKEKSVTDAFKEAGFQTYWIANQSFGDAHIQRTVQNVTMSYFTPVDFDDASNFDENLWKYLDAVLSKNEKKQFIVIHTLGSHFRYNQRYTDAFKKFVPALEGMTDQGTIGEKTKEELINSYDNSILYTDFFLAKTIEKLQNQHAVSYLYYISDHGEGLFDNGVIFHGSLNPPVNEVHIPLFVWYSDDYAQIYPDKIENVKNNIDKKISSSLTFHSLLDMAAINIPNDVSMRRSIACGSLQSDTVRYVINPEREIKIFK